MVHTLKSPVLLFQRLELDSAAAMPSSVGAIMMLVVAMACRAGEFVAGERHGSEHVAGIVLLHRDAFLFGNCIFARLNQQLRGTNDANHRKDAEGNGQKALCVVIKARRCFKTVHHACGNVAVAATAAVAIRCFFHDLASQKNGIHHLHSCPLIGMLTPS